jgi:hypothetical protein
MLLGRARSLTACLVKRTGTLLGDRSVQHPPHGKLLGQAARLAALEPREAQWGDAAVQHPPRGKWPGQAERLAVLELAL